MLYIDKADVHKRVKDDVFKLTLIKSIADLEKEAIGVINDCLRIVNSKGITEPQNSYLLSIKDNIITEIPFREHYDVHLDYYYKLKYDIRDLKEIRQRFKEVL